MYPNKTYLVQAPTLHVNPPPFCYDFSAEEIFDEDPEICLALMRKREQDLIEQITAAGWNINEELHPGGHYTVNAWKAINCHVDIQNDSLGKGILLSGEGRLMTDPGGKNIRLRGLRDLLERCIDRDIAIAISRTDALNEIEAQKNKPTPEPTPEPEIKPSLAFSIAGELYTKYCAAVGGKAFNGDPLPCWLAMTEDPAKTKQSAAWIATAERAIELISALK